MADPNEIDEFLFAQEYSDQTQITYRYMLELISASMPDLEHLEAVGFSKWLKSFEWGESTRYLAACAVKAFLRWRYGAKHPALAVKVKRTDPAPQRTLTAEEVEQLYQSFPVDDLGRRDLALLSLFLDTGLRASEMCRLALPHLHLEEHYLSVKVKGGVWMDKSFSVVAALDVDNWLSVRGTYAVKGVETVFVSLAGRTPGYPLTRDGMRPIVREWGERAGLKESISPHAFRRSGATLGAESGASDQLLMQQFGWKSAQMVRRYTKRLQNRAFAEHYSPVTKVRNG